MVLSENGVRVYPGIPWYTQNGNFSGENDANPVGWRLLEVTRIIQHRPMTFRQEMCWELLDSGRLRWAIWMRRKAVLKLAQVATIRAQGPSVGELEMVWNWRFPKMWIPQTMGFPIDKQFWMILGPFQETTEEFQGRIAVTRCCLFKPKLLWIGSSYVRWACQDYCSLIFKYIQIIKLQSSGFSLKRLPVSLTRRRFIISVYFCCPQPQIGWWILEFASGYRRSNL